MRITYKDKPLLNTGGWVGTVVAAALSWTANHSVGWIILHTLLGWFYVTYRLVVYVISIDPLHMVAK